MAGILFRKISWDKIGIFLSGLCALHCLMMPVILALMPLWLLEVILSSWAHPIFLILIIPTLLLSIKQSKAKRKIAVLFFSGISLLILAWLIHPVIGHTAETITTVIGSAMLIIGHWQKYRQHSSGRSCVVNNK